MSKVFVTGHKNPDTDSICSALGYAALKRGLGWMLWQSVPVR